MLKKTLKVIKKLIIAFFVLSIVSVILFRFVPVPVTPLMISRSIENDFTKWKHNWVPIEEISPNLQVAVIASEDQNFLNHNGFDFKAIEKAVEHNKKSKRIRGASTISQQVAKNVFLWQGRSWVRKGLEVYFTFLIELFWSKERIIEVYLNSIEMGDGIYGAEAASQYWYQKSAKNLSNREAAGIAAILPNPRKFKARNSSNYIERRKDHIVRQMRNLGRLQY
jgi:monofunctional biosynthetic peptidoglycan transglycosylase